MNISSYQKMKDELINQVQLKEGFIKYLKVKQASKASIKSRLRIVSVYFDWLAIENLSVTEVSYTDLLSFMKWCNSREVSQRTIQSYIGTIKHFYNYLLEEELISKDPVTDIAVKGIKRKTLYPILSSEDLHSLYNQYPAESHQDKRNKVMLGMLIYQGLRTTELARLEVSHIKLREGNLDVLGGKKYNGRLLQLESYQVMDLYDYILHVRAELLQMKPKRKSQKPQVTNRLFIGEAGNCYSFSNFMTQLMLKVKQINSRVKNAEQIRSSVITKWLRGHNLREVQYLAGHRYISSTESYLRNDVESLKEEIQQFHPMG
ncbi:tyrosine-type recombinase/integrase [Marivirga arenosa]|uniref:Tyrosine-type recombinase/integrase n=1 Tax=Marivirga arenosa TaxID=3059076 RepID=A0AA51ZSD8_9BACT|nr:tyrosine-type recombinase/integrase [Marivirga sp. BKB1-2]WKK80412.2 tyrosine-type recombinase/integrase [Marivirga sp. BKB1-2]WNB17010.1 tyrosine-type recombinase/integrase [Marivirga sp. BKB1-2]WNB17018.1 tyrosine-type recombinase/integrase [Marivirga sp. BKB1-2]WNB17020.1 tyrosine-type recombinase/integrase [Marivirga sp. BKB1-2]